MNLPEVGGEPKQVRVTLSNGEVCDFEGYVDNISVESPGYAVDDLAVDYGKINMTIRRTGPIETTKQNPRVIPPRHGDEWDTTNCPWTVPGHDDDIAVFPGPIVQLTGWLQPFAYGFAFLLLLWACMAWEKWIGWVMR